MTQTRAFEIDLAAAGMGRRKDFMQCVARLKRMGATFDSAHKVWVLVDEDGDAPEAYELWEWLRRSGVIYTEVTSS